MLTHHGGRVDEAALLFRDAPKPWIDLSTGINPHPWQPRVPIPFDLGPLPTASDLAALEAAAAAYFGTSPDRVAAVPGSEIGLRLLSMLDLPTPHRYVAPGYRTHAAALGQGRPIDATSVGPSPGTLLFANPSNPEGRLLPNEIVRKLAGPGWLVVDEAFADCAPGASIVPELPERAIVLRSFGKFFGLAGLRLGFVIAHAPVIARLRSLIGDWPVSTSAIAYGTAAYADADWIAATRERVADAAARLDRLLIRNGLAPRGECPLFRLVETERPIFDQLARAGILARPFDHDRRWVRIGLPRDEAASGRLEQALMGG